MATLPKTGVTDPYQRVWGYSGLHVVDGAAISAKLGVKPSLTITAQAERAMSLWPNKGEKEGVRLRGALSAAEAVFSLDPMVPAGAPAALEWVQ